MKALWGDDVSSFGSQIRKRLKELHEMEKNVPKIMAEAAEGATIEAVRTAAENTPPNTGHIGGVNTQSGVLAAAWERDSQTTPVCSNGSVKTVLANNEQYASYVSDGHRVDKHFVPGLHIDTIGKNLFYDLGEPGGIMVGTRTTYVEGLYMREKAIGKYRTTVRKELDKRVKEAFK